MPDLKLNTNLQVCSPNRGQCLMFAQAIVAYYFAFVLDSLRSDLAVHLQANSLEPSLRLFSKVLNRNQKIRFGHALGVPADHSVFTKR